MEIFAYFRPITNAMLQIFLLGLAGFILVKKNLVSKEGLSGLANFLVTIVFPSLIFWQIVTKFSFSLFPDWWLFLLLSFIVTALGLAAGYLFSLPIKEDAIKREFICLVAFQNAGYLPLVLVGWILPKEQLSIMLIYLFLFLLGFNLIIWSWGAYFLSMRKSKRFAFGGLFSPPVVATLLGFLFVLFKINMFLPEFILTPLEMLGNCSFPFAIVVVGASLADLRIGCPVDIKITIRLIAAKLILLPLLGILFIMAVKPPYLVSLLLLLQLAVPSATSLAIIARKYGTEEKIVSRGIFVSHIACLVTLPVFLAILNIIVSRPQ